MIINYKHYTMKKFLLSFMLAGAVLFVSAQQDAKASATPTGTKSCCQSKQAGASCSKSQAKACAGQGEVKACAGKPQGGGCCKGGSAQAASGNHVHTATGEAVMTATPAVKSCGHNHGQQTEQPKK